MFLKSMTHLTLTENLITKINTSLLCVYKINIKYINIKLLFNGVFYICN